MTEPCTTDWLALYPELDRYRADSGAHLTDYIRAEAERLPNGTAAKFLAAIKPDTVTITISRDAAEWLEIVVDTYDAGNVAFDVELEIRSACRAALNLSEGPEEEA